MANLTRAVGLTLTDEGYAALMNFARAHHWTAAQAARVIVMERLAAEQGCPGRDAMGTPSMFQTGDPAA